MSAGGFDRGPVADNRLARQLCAELGIDPAQTIGLRIELLPSGSALALWEGRQRLTIEQLNAVLMGVECDAEHVAGQPCDVCGIMRGRPHSPVFSERID